MRLFSFLFCAFQYFPDFVGEHLLVDSASHSVPFVVYILCLRDLHHLYVDELPILLLLV